MSAEVETNELAVEEALEYLVLRGWVTTRITPSGELLYGLNVMRHGILQNLIYASPRFE